jgi:sulfite exporter TauE/SafE
MVTSTLFLTIFIGALVSGWHCALMCGGIAAGLERAKQNSFAEQNTTTLRFISRKKLIFEQFLTHLGRISTYVLLGVMAGTLGFPLWQQGWLPVQRGLFALAAAIFLFQGYLVLTKNKTKTSAWEVWLNSKTAALWSKLSKSLHQPGRKPHFLVGLVWGLVPCGLIYSILPLAFLSGDGLSGGLLMLAFGLGTLPNLLLISGFSARLASWGHQAWTRYLAAGLMIFTGLFGLYRAFTLPDALLKGGFCIG